MRDLYLDGALGPNTIVGAEDGSERVRFEELWLRERGAMPAGGAAGARSERPLRELQQLTRQLLLPLGEFTSGGWLRHRRAFLIAAVGLFPLIIIALLGGETNVARGYWAVAAYFSILWAAFFYHAYPAPAVNLGDAAFCFLGSAFCCTLLLYGIYTLSGAQLLVPWTHSPSVLRRIVGFIGGIGLPEEGCKAAILMLLFQRKDRLSPQTMLFYGLMAGLGFGIYEGVRYQFLGNLASAQTVGGYYLLNVLRLTSLPFLHAVWTGVAGYFFGLALLYPRRRWGLCGIAIGLPAVLHGMYDMLSGSGAEIVVAVVSVFVMNLYLAHTMELERLLRDVGSGPPSEPRA
jgi:RsiW-degrading membrane proteinase PrsW (M82 family)